MNLRLNAELQTSVGGGEISHPTQSFRADFSITHSGAVEIALGGNQLIRISDKDRPKLARFIETGRAS